MQWNDRHLYYHMQAKQSEYRDYARRRRLHKHLKSMHYSSSNPTSKPIYFGWLRKRVNPPQTYPTCSCKPKTC